MNYELQKYMYNKKINDTSEYVTFYGRYKSSLNEGMNECASLT